MQPITRKQGDTFYNAKTGNAEGIVNFDSATGNRLQAGQTETDVPTTIPFSDIASTALTTPSTPPSTTAAGNNAFLESNNTSVIDQRTADLKTQADNQGQVGSEIVKLMGDLGNKGKIQEDVFKQEGVDVAKKQVDDLTSQIEAEQLSSRRQEETLRKSFIGSPAGLNAALNSLHRDSFQRQADMAIVQSAALKRYDTASSIADRVVEAKLEPMRARLDALKFIYSENKESFNKADERLYQEKIKSETREFNKVAETENDIKNVKLQAAKNHADLATMARIAKATTLDEAIQAAGRFLTDPVEDAIKQAQLANLTGKGTDLKIVKINGQDYVQNKDGSFSKPNLPQDMVDKQTVKDKVTKIDDILNSPGLTSTVGTGILSRAPRGFLGTLGKAATGVGLLELPFDFASGVSGSRQNFIASVQQLTKDLTLDKLITAKAAGATFGALSEGELGILSGAATKINDWAVKKNDKVVGYDIDEASFKKELETIKEYTQRAINLTTDNYIQSLDSALQSPSNLYLNAGYNTN